MSGVQESWVTVVLDDRMGMDALVLAASLNRFYTSRPLTVLIDEAQVSSEMICLLRAEFNFVETIQNASAVYLGKDVVHIESMSKVYLWSLLLWKKCVFIDASCLVMEPAEHLFQLEEISAMTENLGSGKSMSLDVFTFEPNRTTFTTISKMCESTGSGEAAIRNHFWGKWVNSPSHHIPEGTLLRVEIDEEHLHCPRPTIVKFNNPSHTEKSSSTSEKYKSGWYEVFAQNLTPQFKNDEKLWTQFEKIASSFQIPFPKTIPNVSSLDELEDAIAIVGMSCRFPGANNTEEFWTLLSEGRCPIQKFPEGRRTFDIPGMRDQLGGFLSCPIDAFDAKFFGISPREAPLIDPQQRFLLEVIWESIEDGGLDGAQLKDKPVGVFFGVLGQDYDHMLPRNGYIGNEYHHRFLGNALSATVGRISHVMGFTGPNVALESDGSSSLAALHLGCQSLRTGESNLVISGGINLIITPRHSGDVIVLPDGQLTPFLSDSSGLVSSEGVGALVLKRHADALNDGDKIRAVIRGSALGNCGDSLSYGTQVPKAQARVCKKALVNANVNPSDVSFIETDGTATLMGDMTELTALEEVYAQDRETPLWIGSVKANIGNGESIAGIASIFKLILALEHESIPKNDLCGKSKSLAPLIGFPAVVPLEHTPWKGPKRIGAASSFSMTGSLVHMILQSTPQSFGNIPSTTGDESLPQLITISAKTTEALEAQRKNYVEFFKNNATFSLADVAYATNVCRTHFNHRLVAMASDLTDLVGKLEGEDYFFGKVDTVSKSIPIGFLFTGQASQYFGMGKGLYTTFSAFRNAIDYCDDIYKEHVGISLKSVLWENESLLQQTHYAQPAIFCTQIALLSLWKHFGIRPSIVLGHSVGEYCAAVAAGVITIQDGFKLVTGRSRLIQKLKEGRMVAIKASFSHAQNLLNELGEKFELDLAAVNSPSETVLSGSLESVEAFEELCGTKAIKTHRLSSSHAFHSRHIDEILDEFGILAGNISYSPPTCTYISSTLGRKMEYDDFTSEYWQCHLRETVHFSTAASLLLTVTSTLIEIGPTPVLLGLTIANNLKNAELALCPSMRKTEENWVTFYSSLAKMDVKGVPIDWSPWFGRRVKKVSLPFYPFQRQNYWFVIKDYTDEEDDKDREGAHFRNKRAHPILGYKIPSPGRLDFVQSKMLKELPYFKDCQVDSFPILSPGGVIELFLAAAYQARPIQKRKGASLLEIQFDNWIRLDAESSIRTTIQPGRNPVGHGLLPFEVRLYEEITSSEWKLGATVLSAVAFEKDIKNETHEFLLEEAIRKGTPLTDIYPEGKEGEIFFENNYRRITKAWSLGDGKVLSLIKARVQDPQRVGPKTEYICFPTILDAMIQTGRLVSKDTFCLPECIRTFGWYGREASISDLFCYAVNDCLRLFTMDGNILADIEGLVFASKDADVKDQVRRESFQSEIFSKFEEDVPPTPSLTNSEIPTEASDRKKTHNDILADVIGFKYRMQENGITQASTETAGPDVDDFRKEMKTSEKLERILRQTLRLPSSEHIDLDQNFIEIGVDSLMGIEIGTKIQQMLPDKQLSSNLIQEYPTLRSILNHLNVE